MHALLIYTVMALIAAQDAAAGAPISPRSFDELTPFGTALTKVAGFEQIARKHGVTVFQDNDSPVIRLAAEGVLGAPPQAVLASLIDYDHQVGVIARVSAIKILERGPNHVVVYQRLNLPVIDDRDYVIRVTWGGSGDRLWVKYHVVTDRGPAPQDGVVRVTHHDGSWQIRPAGDGTSSFMRYQFSMDMAGLIPRWLTKSTAGKEVPAVFSDVCKLLTLQHRTPEETVCLR